MAGVLFIVNVPRKEYETELNRDKTTKTVIQKDKYARVSKLVDELKENKRFGSLRTNIETYAQDDDNVVISKCRSTERLHKNDTESSLYKSKSDTNVSEENVIENGKKKSFRSSWSELKHVINPRRSKLKITRPGTGVDILASFHWDTPLETILYEIINRLNIKNATWNLAKNSQFWQVIFSLESGCQCEELLQVLRTFGVGSRHQSSVSVIPCALYYKSPFEKKASEKDGELHSDKGAWSRFSSSVRSRTNLAQVLHEVKAEAALTFDWIFLLVVAAFVAAIGLVENSTIILVASMLISPLMGPITAGTLGTTVRDRSLQRMGVTHELFGLFMSLVIGFIFGLAICAVDERYGVGDWPTYEMMSRCEIRSLWVGILVAIPSGAGVALAVLGDYTASLVGVAISASLLPPAVNAGLLWAMALVHLIFMDDDTRWTAVVKTTIYSDNQPTELAVLGAVSLCLTLVNILCIFLAGVAVYKVKEVCPLERRDISWWRANRNLLQSSKKKDKRDSVTKPWDFYSRWRNEIEGKKAQDKRTSEIGSKDTAIVGSKPPRPPTPVIVTPEVETVMTITGPHRSLNIDNYVTLNVDTPGMFAYTDRGSKKSAEDKTKKTKDKEQKYPFYSLCDPIEDENKNVEHNKLPTLEPSLSFTVGQERIVLALSHQLYGSEFSEDQYKLVFSTLVKMPAGVVFVICIPSSNYEHVLKFGKPREMIPIEDQSAYRQCRLEVELRNKKSRSIPVHLTQEYYNEAFNPTLENINEDDEFITMESILQELLRKLNVEHVVWVGDKTGNYFEVIFPLPTGDPCETMLHCLTKLGIGVRCRSIVNVVPCNVVHSAIENEPDEETILRKAEDANRWRSFVESIRSKLTVKQVVDGVRGGGELNFDYLTLIVTADSLAALGLVENNSSNIVAAMLVSPLMGPVMSITFGCIIADRTLIRNGFESLSAGMFVSLIFGFIFGLILGSTDMPWGFGDFPTEEMKSRGDVRSLWMAVLWALTSGTGVALALLQGSAGPLIGIAISASLLPPVVNCGLFWALACIWLLYPGVKVPHLRGEAYVGNTSYKPLYHDYLPIEFAVNGIVSCCLTIINVICIFITAIIFLKIKEVAAPYTSTPDLRRFWETDIKVAREANRASLRRAEESERAEYMLDDMNEPADDVTREKLQAAVQEALDDETYRKVKRMSYQSHTADEVMRTIGFQARTPVSMRSSRKASGSSTSTPHKMYPKDSNFDEIAALDKLLTSLLGLKENRRSKSFSSHRNTPRSSRMPPMDDFKRNRRTESWPDRIFENSVVRSVMTSLKTSRKNSAAEEPFLTPK